MAHAQDDERAADILRRRASGLLSHDEMLTELADADCVMTLATAIAQGVEIRTDVVLRALGADNDETISVMCRAAGFRINSYSALLRMRRRRNCGRASAPSRSLTFFSALSRASAERMLPRMAANFGKAER